MQNKLKGFKQIKIKKGFTLIELLAVIVILAIIALIAVPGLMSIIDNANKKAFKDSAYGILNAGELYYSKQEMNFNTMTEAMTFNFPNDIGDLSVKGELPQGTMIITKDGDIALAIKNGKFCVTKGINDKDITMTNDVENCKLPYMLGDVVYYNPNEAKICTEIEWDNNEDKNGKSGCMRWYVYALNGSTPKLILDHNTTDGVAWISKDDYVANQNCTGDDYHPAVCNDQGAKTLEKQLIEDTKNWEVEADIITLEEAMTLVPYYQELDERDKNLFLNPTKGNTEVIDGYYAALNAAWYDMPEKESHLETWLAQKDYLIENYSELLLPKYMYYDLMDSCYIGTDECYTYGYWTKTAFSYFPNSYEALYVSDFGIIDYDGIIHRIIGIRPVIVLSK